ncbi:helix-turn-helix domain-containing protein [Paenibacillus sp. YN15]|uniref:helix-turn-helix domain-containing protein n=1 Tax=Paenibacillus sp. YN15 TaxID=1742774 RepID=UPI000DCED043|nr:helix-turn-helix transcriptional regulator [Paenibacillus sp. YN15]RAV02694.1 transcriptional regulator [Paenibacillus sp. YN15]
MEFKQLVGEQVRKARKLRGITQEKLAELSGVSLSYLSDVERSQRNISLESLGKIIEALRIEPAQLFTDDSIPEDASLNDANDSLRALNILLKDREKEDIDFVLAVAREYLNAIDRKS